MKELAAQAGVSMQIVLDNAIENYRRQCFLDQANTAFAKLKKKQEKLE